MWRHMTGAPRITCEDSPGLPPPLLHTASDKKTGGAEGLGTRLMLSSIYLIANTIATDYLLPSV